MLAVEPRPARVVHVCEDIACRCIGSDELIAQLEERFGGEGELSDDGSATWYRSPCLGQCDRAPGSARRAMPATSRTSARSRRRRPPQCSTCSRAATPARRRSPCCRRPATRRCGCCAVPLPTGRSSLDEYRAHGGYAALRRAIELGPEGVIREVKDSKLQGRGGAAFPTGVKWEAVARQPARPHYLVCNADESEPGTFKDRVLMERDPFSLIEAMTIAAYATGCERGLRLHPRRVPRAAARARGGARRGARARLSRRRHPRRGLLASRSRSARVPAPTSAARRRRSSSRSRATAASRATSRRSPSSRASSASRPSSTTSRRSSTCSTSSRAPGPSYAETGTEVSTGTKLFCVCGHVERPGRLRGAVRDDAPRAVRPRGRRRRAARSSRRSCMGGAAGGFLRPDELDLPLTFEGAREAKTTLGSGVVLVLDETVDMPRLLMRLAAFFRNESCGQCVPCRVGTVRQQEALARLVSGKTRGGVETRARGDRRGRPVHARRVDLRPRPDCVERDRIGDRTAWGVLVTRRCCWHRSG